MNAIHKISRLPFGVAVVLLALSANFAGATDCFVLSVGVDAYQHVNKLQGCVSDAQNTVSAFSSQRGKLFSQVHAETLVDGQATHANILNRMRSIGQRGTRGDYIVVFLSGHGGRPADNRSWYFLPVDYASNRHAATALTDRQILDVTDAVALQGKKVFIIVDSCFAGQLSITAQSYLAKHRNPQGGGMVLMLSSAASQLSNALGSYSAFAKAFADGMQAGDVNRDGRITLQEVRKYSFDRTYQLLKQKNITARQDSEFAWSPSMSGESPVALLRDNLNTTPVPPIATNPNPNPNKVPSPFPTTRVRVLNGNETLQGFGRLTFQLHTNGRAIMQDAQGTTEGTWTQQGANLTIRFAGGRITYSGMLQNGNINGVARNERTSWNWTAHDASVR